MHFVRTVIVETVGGAGRTLDVQAGGIAPVRARHGGVRVGGAPMHADAAGEVLRLVYKAGPLSAARARCGPAPAVGKILLSGASQRQDRPPCTS